MNKFSMSSSESGIQSIEEKLQARIQKIQKTYRIRYILLTLGFIAFTFISSMNKDITVPVIEKRKWQNLSHNYQKMTLPVVSYIDAKENQFPIDVDIYNENKKLITKAKLHFLELIESSLQGTFKAYLEIPEEQLSNLPKQSSLTFRLYPHLKVESRKRKSYEIVF